MYSALTVYIILQGFFLNSMQYKFFHSTNYLCTSYNCNSGKAQSPIAIDDEEVDEIGMPALKLDGYYTLMKSLTMHNSGEIIDLNFESRKSVIPVISGGLLNDEYVLESFHFHWGKKDNTGGEHIINDEKFPLELHLLHRNKKYVNLAEAYSYEDGLAIIAVLFETGTEQYPALDIIIEHLPDIWVANTTTVVNEYFKLSSLLPSNVDNFYTYKGSLSSPPYLEVATWIIFSDTVPISTEQMDEFRKLEDENGYLILGNYRHPQEFNNRRVYYRNGLWKHFIVNGFVPKSMWYTK